MYACMCAIFICYCFYHTFISFFSFCEFLFCLGRLTISEHTSMLRWVIFINEYSTTVIVFSITLILLQMYSNVCVCICAYLQIVGNQFPLFFLFNSNELYTYTRINSYCKFIPVSSCICKQCRFHSPPKHCQSVVRDEKTKRDWEIASVLYWF